MKTFRMITLSLLVFCGLCGGVPAMEADSGPRRVTVEAEGVGASKDEAMKDAWMEAVRKAVGMFMAADTQMSDDELTEKIAAFSRGQVNAYEVLGENVDSGGIWRITIRAEIDQDLLRENATKSAQTVKVDAGDDLVAQVVTGNEKTESRGDVLDASNRLLDLTNCLTYSAKLEAHVDPETGKKGFRMRHQLLFDADRYNGRLAELHLLFGKTADSKREMTYINQGENRAVLNILKTKNMPTFDETKLDMGKVTAANNGQNPFHALPVTWLPARAKFGGKFCNLERFGRVQAEDYCDPADGPLFYVFNGNDSHQFRQREDLRDSVVIPKNASTGVVYKTPEYRQILARFQEPLTLRFQTNIGEGLDGESVNSPDFKVLVGLCVVDNGAQPLNPSNPAPMLVMAPLFYVPGKHGNSGAALGASNSPGIVFHQKLDLSPEDIQRHRGDINAGYILE